MMLLGVVLHSSLPYLAHAPAEWRYLDAQRSVVLDVTNYLIHMFRMPAFFLVAGFFAALLIRQRGAAGMLRHRVQRVLFPLLVFWFPCQLGNTLATSWARTGALEQGWSTLAGYAPWAGLRVPGALGHLWFLVDLFLMCAVAAGVHRLAGGSRALRVVTWVVAETVRARRGVLLLAVPTAAVLVFEPFAVIVDPGTWLPDGLSQLANGGFFLVGACVESHRDLLEVLAARAGRLLATGAALLACNLLLLLWQVDGASSVSMTGATRLDAPQVLAAAVGALAMWQVVLGLVGFFHRRFASPRPAWRYLSDASYWVYLSHHPVSIAWAGALGAWNAWALLKCVATVTLTTAVSLASYHRWVRSTWVGQWLNGHRHPPAPLRQPAHSTP
ncbi:MAG: acyltransferase family protein [Deltaproteobacteria bacterium]|nr:acyltransferase family protein [Deltaproteobacteria bacterium]